MACRARAVSASVCPCGRGGSRLRSALKGLNGATLHVGVPWTEDAEADVQVLGDSDLARPPATTVSVDGVHRTRVPTTVANVGDNRSSVALSAGCSSQ